MSISHLFGAEVNQIQVTLFAASRQRQVVGGSRLLAKFSDLAGKKAQEFYGANIIVNKGGKFWLVFSSNDDASQFGTFLANSYLMLLGGRMTISPPQQYDTTKENCSTVNMHCYLNQVIPCFNCAKNEVEKNLSQLKTQHAQAVTNAHSPTTAFCESSGFGLATYYGSSTKSGPKSNAPSQYISKEAYIMKEVGHVTKKGQEPKEAEDDESFLDRFVPVGLEKRPWIYHPEMAARYDSFRNNIAYLIADGNNIGRYFGYCESEQELKDLSDAVDTAVEEAIKQPILNLWKRLEKPWQIPLLPLIAAGDDVFIMLPAPYALDYARQFCLLFESALHPDNVNIIAQLQGRVKSKLNPPTISAAIVICKANYPYNLAYQRGHDLLDQTKQVVKTTGQEKNEWYSAVSFDVIIGNELVSGEQTKSDYRHHLITYWAVEYDSDAPPSTFPQSAGDLQALLDQRLCFKRLPNKRRNEVRQLFDAENLGTPEWETQLRLLQQRIETTSSKQMRQYFDDALMKLGDPTANHEFNPAYWRFIQRNGHNWHAHGLPDLLEAWHYAQDLTKALSAYEEERAL